MNGAGGAIAIASMLALKRVKAVNIATKIKVMLALQDCTSVMTILRRIKKMKIIHEFPRLVSKPKYGLYLVTAIRSDGTIHSQGSTAMSSTEA